MPRSALTVVNLVGRTFECTYGRGCAGQCCQNGRPPVESSEEALITANLEKFLPLLRSTARRVVERDGYLSKRQKAGSPMLRVVEGWCVFFNEGCVLHKVGAAEGDKFRYKPAPCSLFPLDHSNGTWWLRQHGYRGEKWLELPCLAPGQSQVLATKSLVEELAFAEQKLS